MKKYLLKFILLSLFCCPAIAGNSRQLKITLHLKILQHTINDKMISPYIARIGDFATTDTTTKKAGIYSDVDSTYIFNLEMNDSNTASYHLFFKYDTLFYEVPLYGLIDIKGIDNIVYQMDTKSIDKTPESNIYMYKYYMLVSRMYHPHHKYLVNEESIDGESTPYYKYDLCYKLWYR